MLAVKYRPPFSGTNQRQKGIPTINSEIFEIIDSNTFWDHLLLITKILEPYCKLLNILQCDKAHLFQVVHSLGYLVQFWMNQPNNELNCSIGMMVGGVGTSTSFVIMCITS